MRVFIRSAAAVAVAALFPVIGAAQQGPPPQGPPPQGGGRGGVRAVQPAPRQQAQQRPNQLTEQQREQMRTFDEQHRQAAEAGRRELEDLHRQFNEALASAQIDNGKVTQLRNQIVQKETALAQQRLDREAKIASILTAEQRQARGRGRGGVMMRGPQGPAGMGPGGGRGRMGQPGMGGMGRGGGVGDARGVLRRRIELRAVRPGQLRGGRGAAGGGVLLRRGGDDLQLRAEIRRLEMQLEALRRRIGR